MTMIEKIVKFMTSAGAFALVGQKDADFFKSRFKSDAIEDIVTFADMTVTEMFREFVRNEFSDLDYVIVNEESIASFGSDPLSEINKHEYVFVLDPIDGTLTYANGYYSWGIILGVFKNGMPYAGGIFMPSVNTMIYADENDTYVIENGVKRKLKPFVDTDESAPVFLFNNYNSMQRPGVDMKSVALFSFYSCVENYVHIALGRARGYPFAMYMWDIAGAIPIFKNLGISVCAFDSGKELDLFDPSVYRTGTLRVNKVYVVSRPKYYDYMKTVLEPLDKCM